MAREALAAQDPSTCPSPPMHHAIALNASHFNTQRMVQEYIVKAYF